MKIITEVWCIDPDAIKMNEQIGQKVQDEGDKWMPYGFDLFDVRSLKQSGDIESGFIKPGEATALTFHNGDTVTVRIRFTELSRWWMEMGTTIEKVELPDHGDIRPEDLHWAIKIRRLVLIGCHPSMDTQKAEELGHAQCLYP